MLISIVCFIIVFTIIALSHELGHYIWARRAGIRVIEFGFGFGPRLFSFTRGNTIFSINLIPILAFVRIAGEGEEKEDLETPESEKFQAKTPLQKFLTIVAGPLMNLACAVVILSILFSFAGVPSGISNEIGSINKNSVAEKAGLKVGDRLLAINGHSFAKMELTIEFIHQAPEKPLTLTIERAGKKLLLAATPKYNPKLKMSLLGFAPKPIYERVNPLLAVYYGFEQAGAMILMTLAVLGHLIIGGLAITDLAGPIGIAQITGQEVASGFISLVWFTAFLNVNIGVLNLLPLPALDGGRLVFILIEWIRRRPVDPKIEMQINQWGFFALLTIIGLVSVSDIFRLFGR